MSWLPIVERELRVGARRRKTYWLRQAAAVAGLGVSAWVCLWSTQSPTPVSIGKSLFSALTVLAFGYCLLIGPFITADSVSEEKREGTLGLLFLTDLASYDVVLGKWIAHALGGLYGLLAILPMLGLPLLFGGVTPGEYVRTALAVVNAILFSLTAGLLVSTLSREQPKAVLATGALVLGVSGLIPGLAVVASSRFLTQPLAGYPPVALASPAYTGVLAVDAAFKRAPQDYWLSLGLVHALCWLFLALTVAFLPRVWREEPAERPTVHRWLWRFGYTQGWRRAFRRRLEKNPVFALAARLRWPHAVFWTLVALVAINVFWLTYGYRRNASTYQFHTYFSHALVFLNRIWITAMACRFFLEARRTGALELMLTTPMPVATLLRGHWRALRRLFSGPVLAIALLHVGYVWGSLKLSGPASPGTGYYRYYAMGAAGSMISFLTDVLALCWVGGWLSLSVRKAHLAMLLTFTLVVVVPWTVGYFTPNLQVLFPRWFMRTAGAGLVQNTWFNYLTAIYLARPLCWVLKNLALVVWARWKIRRHFRDAAAQTYRVRWPWRRRHPPQPPSSPPQPEVALAAGALGDA